MIAAFGGQNGADKMRLCRLCQSKMPEAQKGPCDACKAERSTSADDGIQQHVAVSIGQYDAALDKLRKGTRWQKVRLIVVYRDPICKRCDTRLTEIVDHVVPAAVAIVQAKESKRWPYDPVAGYYLTSNLQGLCRQCHAVKTAEDKQHTGDWPSVVEAYDAAPKKVWRF